MAAAVMTLSNCPIGTIGTTFSSTGQAVGAIALPMKAQDWPAAFAALVNFSGGGPATGTVSVQVSLDPNANPQQPSGAGTGTPRWNFHDILVNLTADKNDSIVFPIAYVRLIAITQIVGTVSLFMGIPDQI